MGIFRELGDNVTEIGVMTVTIVLISILLNNLKSTDGVTASINTSIDNAVTGVGTPITYISIIILVIVFAAILTMLVQKLRDRS